MLSRCRCESGREPTHRPAERHRKTRGMTGLDGRFKTAMMDIHPGGKSIITTAAARAMAMTSVADRTATTALL